MKRTQLQTTGYFAVQQRSGPQGPCKRVLEGLVKAGGRDGDTTHLKGEQRGVGVRDVASDRRNERDPRLGCKEERGNGNAHPRIGNTKWVERSDSFSSTRKNGASLQFFKGGGKEREGQQSVL